MKILKTITLRIVELRLEEIISKENNTTIGYTISRYHNGLRYYLNSTTTLSEAEENLAFYVNVYK
mgnify:CR=1 FL=1|tara:strand:+ start:1201 stop:1395 length:195 start_codon:yes stop_codon:yes gene_type:complete